jgi:hypothetical protein
MDMAACLHFPLPEPTERLEVAVKTLKPAAVYITEAVMRTPLAKARAQRLREKLLEHGASGNGAGFMGGFGVNCRGLLAAWNRTRGYVGALAMGADSADAAIYGNTSACVLPSDLDLAKGLDAEALFVPDDSPTACLRSAATLM